MSFDTPPYRGPGEKARASIRRLIGGRAQSMRILFELRYARRIWLDLRYAPLIGGQGPNKEDMA